MNKAFKITVEGKEYPIKFGYGATVLLGELWSLPGMLDVFQKALGILGLDGEAAKNTDVDKLDSTAIAANILKFKNLEIMIDVVSIGVQYASPDLELPFTRNDLSDSVVMDIENSSAIFMSFINTMPRPKDKTPQPKKSTGKGKPRTAAK